MSVENVKIEFADNGGCIVCYEEKTPPPGGDKLSSCSYDYKKEAFSPGEDAAAMKRAKELHAQQLKDNGKPDPYKGQAADDPEEEAE